MSNGVDVKVLCEEKDADDWFTDQISYLDEEKITLKILEIAEDLNYRRSIKINVMPKNIF